MKSREKQVRRLSKLGVDGFETTAETRQLQRDVLLRLASTAVSRRNYAGLRDCRPGTCGRRRCSDVCAHGARSRRLNEIPAAYRLLNKHDGPLFEVRISRAVWSRKAPMGALSGLR
jgi:hypothetical protein